MNKQDLSNFKKSAGSIFVGFLISFLLISFLADDVAQIYKSLFIEPLHSTAISTTILTTLILIIISLAMAFSLKARLFNIGIPGQMLAGAMPSTLLAITVMKNGFPGGWLILLIVAALGGAMLGGIAGYLKAKFKIHEVVSTIMLNWIIFYFGKEIFSKPQFKLGGFPGSKFWPVSLQTKLPIIMIIAILLVAIVIFVFKKTKIGYKILMVGEQPEVADYSGISKEKIQTLTLAISGAIAGLAGAIYYGTYTGQYTIPLYDGLDSIGFDAIVVSLVAFNNPIAIIIISTIFAIVKIGGYSASVHFPYAAQLISLTMGIIMYCVAASEGTKLLKKLKKKPGGKK